MTFRLSRISHPRATTFAALLVTLFLLAFGAVVTLTGQQEASWQDRQGAIPAHGGYPPASIRRLEEMFRL